MNQQYHSGLAVHETAELHELLMFKTNCLQKSTVMESQVHDPQLKALLQQDIQTGRSNIQVLQQLLPQQ
ncbi:similar to spore coat protein [Evansella caseinilytica]|uniref:Similar to spore coat protein n=1 Tax=Evansella caseinilytica TaxID=1503961 RepID=A0A1H3QDB7_9BACI|nr:spore coat protein [Evansella caseinilytica]SDZ11058.1 similar to spore coat protein [Evansella caseinilytica]